MFCRFCGYQNSDGAKYCAQCRKKLPEAGRNTQIRNCVIVVSVLLAGILAGSLLVGREKSTISEHNSEGYQTILENKSPAFPDISIKADPLVLSYHEKTDSAPARYYYNEAGQLVRMVQEQWSQVTQYEYHTNGLLKKERILRSDKPYYITEYDERGNPTAEYSVIQSAQQAVPELVYSYANVYDSLGRLVQCTKTAAGEQEELFAYTYHPDGSYEIDCSYSTFYEGEKLLHDHVVRSYSPEGVLTLEVWDVEDYLSCTNFTAYTFDDHGNLVLKTHDYRNAYTDQREDVTYSHTYDPAGFLVKTEVSSYGHWITPEHEEHYPKELKDIITYSYDPNGRMTKKNVQNLAGEFTIENTWEYDVNGNLIRFHGIPGEEYSGYIEEIWQYQPLSEVLYSG